MANQIRFKRASGSDPSASDLAIGEPGLRTDTAELFFKKDDGTIAKVSGGGGGPDFKYLELRNAANNGAASYPGNDFTLVEAGTTTAVSPAAAATLLVSVSGVIQKPNAGTSTSGITGFIVDGSRFKTATNLPAAPDFIIYQESGGIGEPSDNTVTSAKIVDGAIVNADINASAAIAGSKISPDFGSQNVVTTGTLQSDNMTISGTAPKLDFVDTNANSDFRIIIDGGIFYIQDTTNSNATRLTIGSDGQFDFEGNVDCNNGLDVTGAISSTGTITITNEEPKISLVDSGHNPDFEILNTNGTFKIKDATNGIDRLKVNSDGHVDIQDNLDVGNGIDVEDGDITLASGHTVDGRDVSADGSKLDGIESGATADQTNSEIKTAYEANSNTNAFTDALLSKLNGIAASATNVTNTNQLTNGAGFITATLTNEQVQDIVGGMVTGNTESGITVTYQDSDGTLDFSVASQTDNNFTTTLKNKLDGIAASATNVTNNNQLTNGAGYLTSSSTLSSSNLSGALPAIDGSNLTGIAAFPSGTRMLFQQTNAPTGWTKDTSDTNNRALRVVSGSAGSGGSVAFTTAFASKSVSGSIANATAGGSIGNTSAGGSVSNHTLSTSQIPAHSHSMTQRNAGLGCGPNIPQAGIPGTFGCNTNSTSFSTNNTGGGGSHNHGFSGSAHNHSFSGSAHNHSFSGTAINLAVQYLDVIIASKN